MAMKERVHIYRYRIKPGKCTLVPNKLRGHVDHCDFLDTVIKRKTHLPPQGIQPGSSSP